MSVYDHGIDGIYIGTRNAMIAECAAFDPMTIGIPADKCRYLVKPIGRDNWDTEWHSTFKSAKVDAMDLARKYGVKVCSV